MKSNLGALPAASLIVALFVGITIGIIGTIMTNLSRFSESHVSTETYNNLRTRLEATVQQQNSLLQNIRSFDGTTISPLPKVVTNCDVKGNSQIEFRQKLSLTNKRMRSRNELPALLTKLGYTGEGVEVGVRTGDHSKYIMTNWAGCSKFHMVDPWKFQDETLYKDVSNRDQQHQNQLHDDLKAWMVKNFPTKHEIHRAYSVDASKKFTDNSLDFIYIDARHDFDGVMEDLNAWYPKLQVGGIFAGHDFVPDGNLKEGKFGVQGALAKFTKEHGIEVQSISDKDIDGGRSEPQHVDGGWTTWYFVK